MITSLKHSNSLNNLSLQQYLKKKSEKQLWAFAIDFKSIKDIILILSGIVTYDVQWHISKELEITFLSFLVLHT